MIKFRYKNEEERDFSARKIAKSIIRGVRDKSKEIAQNTKEGVEKVAFLANNVSPGAAAKEVVGMAAENPVAALGNVAPIPGSRIISIFAEDGLKKSKSYDRATKKAGKFIRNNEVVGSIFGEQPQIPTGISTSPKSKFMYHLKSGLADISTGVQNFGRAAYRTAAYMASNTEEESQRNYTIQEGHYTGPKDMEKVPGVIEVLGKATIGGSAVGALAGGVLKETGTLENTGIFDGAKKGGKVGFFTGIALKALLNHLHKPMSKVKYQEVDRILRREFGMYRIAGLTVGDTREKRKTYDEKFGTNDRDVLNYPINICINNNQVTMYTLGLSDDLLERLNKSLDYYCKKYSGMEYSSRVINSKTNTYSVNITFTNYEAISSFIMEISEVLGVRINLLNNDVLPETKIGKSEVKSEEKIFSNIPSFSKYDITQIFLKAGANSISALAMGGPAAGFATLVHQTLSETLNRMAKKEVIRLVGGSRKDYDNDFLLSELKRLGYMEGPHYTKGVEKSDLNLSMICGKVILTSKTGCKEDLMMPKLLKGQDYKKTDINGKANLWTFLITSKGSFDVFLKTLIGSVKPNIYD